jgi:hypothetical protein
MRPGFLVFAFLLSVPILGAGSVRAQDRRPALPVVRPESLTAILAVARVTPSPAPPRVTTPASLASTTSSPRATPPPEPASGRDPRPAAQRHSWPHVAIYGAGGAILGGWAGFMASQIAWSDWRDGPGRSAERLRFSLVGAALGLVAGTLVGRRPPAEAAVPVPSSSPIRGPITRAQIRASSARTLTQLLRELRPEWLHNRGVDILMRGVPVPVSGVRVYLDGELLGGLDTLDEVSIDAVTGVQFFDAAAAVLRWGAGNEDGAILLSTGPRS